ncbi:MAG: helix-turn-helix domain-containing protein [Thermodesulfobacteriota bacterium]
MSHALRHLTEAWQEVLQLAPVRAIRSESEYEEALSALDRLLVDVGADEAHPLYELVDVLGTLVHAYEEEHLPIPDTSGPEVLRYLMAEHGLTQSDLPEVGSQGVVSELLAGKRELNVRQLRVLAQRFGVSPSVFF